MTVPAGFHEIQWKRGGMVHLARDGTHRALCGGNVYRGQVGSRSLGQPPDAEQHRCRRCKRLAQP